MKTPLRTAPVWDFCPWDIRLQTVGLRIIEGIRALLESYNVLSKIECTIEKHTVFRLPLSLHLLHALCRLTVKLE